MDTDTIQKRGGASRVISAVALVVVVAVAVLGGWWVMNDREESVSTVEAAAVSISQDDLAAAAQARVFLGHQSVGANILEGVPVVYEEAGLEGPPIISDPGSETAGGFIANTYLGENGQPLGKIQDFDRNIRSGMAAKVDVGAMKLCWADFDSSTDVDAVFTAYRQTVEALARDFPDVTFLHITTPLTTESTGVKARIKNLLGRDTNASNNVVREKYNELMRQQYGESGLLLDLAQIESSATDGSRVSGEYRGDIYYALAPELASDPGHLNGLGSRAAASEFLETVANAARG